MSSKIFMCVAYLLPVIAGANEIESHKDIELVCNITEEINTLEDILVSAEDLASDEDAGYSPVEFCTLDIQDLDQEFVAILDDADAEDHLAVFLVDDESTLACLDDEAINLGACTDESCAEMLV